MSTNIHRPYIYDVLGLYISLVNNSVDQIILYWSTSIKYPNQYINQLIKNQFNPIDKCSCQPVGCQVILRTLRDMEYIITFL